MKRLLILVIVAFCSFHITTFGQTRYEITRALEGLTYTLASTQVANCNGLLFEVRTCNVLSPTIKQEGAESVSDFIITYQGHTTVIAIELESVEEMIEALQILKAQSGPAFYNLRTEHAYSFKSWVSRYPGVSVHVDLVLRYLEDGERKYQNVSSRLNPEDLIKALEAVKKYRDTEQPK